MIKYVIKETTGEPLLRGKMIIGETTENVIESIDLLIKDTFIKLNNDDSKLILTNSHVIIVLVKIN